MLILDGSEGEGGGQILRTALALSLLTGKPFELQKIRGKRKKPGLLRQHLTGVKAAKVIGQAQVEGDFLGSQRLVFQPYGLIGGHHHFSIGSAGSAMLVVQTILPALLRAPTASVIEVEGGTHNPASPPYPFFERVFLPALQRMGAQVSATLVRPGFFPAGGGLVRIQVQPSALRPLYLTQRGPLTQQRAVALVAGLPGHVADRELGTIRAAMGWPPGAFQKETLDARLGPGNVVYAEVTFGDDRELITGFGEKGVPAENIAQGVVENLQRFIAAEVPVGEHLADQLILPLAMVGQGAFLTQPLSLHSVTQIQTVQRFLDIPITTETHHHQVSVRIG